MVIGIFFFLFYHINTYIIFNFEHSHIYRWMTGHSEKMSTSLTSKSLRKKYKFSLQNPMAFGTGISERERDLLWTVFENIVAYVENNLPIHKRRWNHSIITKTFPHKLVICSFMEYKASWFWGIPTFHNQVFPLYQNWNTRLFKISLG